MPSEIIAVDVLIIGASASGLMCAIEAGKRGRSVLVLDHANKAGKKILMSGGGRCNFTNYAVSAENYLSHNPHFCKSALSRYTQWDFIAMVNTHEIAFHEREHGQLFCDNSAKDILNMLLAECRQANVRIELNSHITSVTKAAAEKFQISVTQNNLHYIYQTQSLVIASGGLSIPKMCASPFGYKIAEQFGHHIHPTRAALVPFTLHTQDKDMFAPLSGIAVNSIVSNQRTSFRENMLFTHRGLSGPAILQISSYWYPGESVTINVLPDVDIVNILKMRRDKQPRQKLKTVLTEYLPKRLLQVLLGMEYVETPLQEISQAQCQVIADKLQQWQLKPNGTEGYRSAEVTLGGVDCNELSSQTMQSKLTEGLYFIGEVVDVTGWLGGYNFQWAWSSGWCAGQVV